MTNHKYNHKAVYSHTFDAILKLDRESLETAANIFFNVSLDDLSEQALKGWIQESVNTSFFYYNQHNDILILGAFLNTQRYLRITQGKDPDYTPIQREGIWGKPEGFSSDDHRPTRERSIDILLKAILAQPSRIKKISHQVTIARYAGMCAATPEQQYDAAQILRDLCVQIGDAWEKVKVLISAINIVPRDHTYAHGQYYLSPAVLELKDRKKEYTVWHTLSQPKVSNTVLRQLALDKLTHM